MGSSDSLSCECGQVLFDVANRKPGETLTCPWCSKEYRYLGGTKVERIGGSKSKSREKDAKAKPPSKESASKISASKVAVRRKESGDEPKNIVLEGEEQVLTNFDKETAKTKAFSARKKAAGKPGEDGESAAPRKKGGNFGDAPGGVFPMLGFMAGFSALAFVALGALFPENHQHKRSTPWGEPLSLKSPWPELIAMILGQVFGFFGWCLYVYRLHTRQKAAKAEAAANPEPEKKADKSTTSSSERISVRKKSTSTRETKRDRKSARDENDDDGGDVDEDEHESER